MGNRQLEAAYSIDGASKHLNIYFLYTIRCLSILNDCHIFVDQRSSSVYIEHERKHLQDYNTSLYSTSAFCIGISALPRFFNGYTVRINSINIHHIPNFLMGLNCDENVLWRFPVFPSQDLYITAL